MRHVEESDGALRAPSDYEPQPTGGGDAPAPASETAAVPGEPGCSGDEPDDHDEDGGQTRRFGL